MLSIPRLRIRLLSIVLLVCGLTSPCSLLADQVLIQEQIYKVFESHKSAIVRVKAAFKTEEEDAKPSQVNLRVGTGFFVSQEGHVLVSASRAMGADRIQVEFNGSSYPAEVVGHDPLTNVSLLRVLKLPEDFEVIRLDGFADKPKAGALVMAIACPLDFEPSPSLGMIGGIDKKLGDRIFPTAYLRTTISIGAGQGGCPILDLNGRLIGMSVASIPDLNGSYCLPTPALASVKEDLLYSGKPERGWLGLEVKENLVQQNEYNVFISKIITSSPAEEAGLKEGDLIISLSDMPVKRIIDLPSAIFKTRIDRYAPIKVIRGDKSLSFSIKAVERP